MFKEIKLEFKVKLESIIYNSKFKLAPQQRKL